MRRKYSLKPRKRLKYGSIKDPIHERKRAKRRRRMKYNKD